MPIKKAMTLKTTKATKIKKAATKKKRAAASVKKTSLEDLIMKVSSSTQSPDTSSARPSFHTFTDLLSEQDAQESTSDFASFLTIEPYFAFAYWEITPQSMLQAASKVGADAKLILRFYDITDSKDISNVKFWDFEVFDRIGNWYLKLENPAQRLHLEIGVKSSTKSFQPIMGSDIMHMPKQAIAGSSPIRWIVTDNDHAEDYIEANTDILKKTLGPYFYDLLMRGRFDAVAGSSMEAIFHRIEKL